MRTSRLRAIAAGLVAMSVMLGLSSCTPPTPYAWMLNADGSVSFTFCDEFVVEKIELSYTNGSTVVDRVVLAGPTASLGEGVPIYPAPTGWLRAEEHSSGESWTRFSFVLLAQDYAPGYSGPESDRLDGLVETYGAGVNRSDLRRGEWVWSSGSTPDCQVHDAELADPLEPATSGALDHEQVVGLISSAEGSADALAAALVSTRSAATIVGFQNRVLFDLHDAGLPEGTSLADALIAVYGNPDVVLAAPAAANMLGYAWNPHSTALYDWARETYPESAVLGASADPFDQLLEKR